MFYYTPASPDIRPHPGGGIYAKLGWHKDIGGTTAIADATGTMTLGGPGSPGLAVQSDSG